MSIPANVLDQLANVAPPTLPMDGEKEVEHRIGDELIKDKNCKELTGHDFMKLLVEQLKNQNPLEPTNSSDMMGQISSLTSARLSESLDLFSRNQNSTLGQGMLDREVTVRTIDPADKSKVQEITGQVSSVKDIGKESCKIEVNCKFYSPKDVISIKGASEDKSFTDANILGKQVTLDTINGDVTGKVMALSNPNSDAHIVVDGQLYSPKAIKVIKLREEE